MGRSLLQKETVDKNNYDRGVPGQGKAALTEIYKGESPAVDIVAVHGINGDALDSFTTEKTKKIWLGDPDMLPRDVKNCRVLTFSYPASVTAILGRTSSDRILQHAHTLVAELAADRELEHALERPIIFVCHSMGGIIVKRALVYSASRTGLKIEHLHSIYVSTYAVMFFGTPHQGSNKANLATFAQRMVDVLLPSKIVDTDSQLLDALKEGSEVLQDINDNFTPLMKRFCVFFFWEQEKTNLGVKWDYVVTESSAAPILDNTDRAGLRYDHRNMCRFASRDAPGYKLVIASIIRYARDAPAAISRRWANEREMLMSMRRNEAEEMYQENTSGRIEEAQTAPSSA